MAVITGAQGIESCDFYEGTLTGLSPDPAWVEVDALNNCTVGFEGALSSNAWVTLAIPASEHLIDTGSTNNALCLMQPASNGDFILETKIETRTTTGGIEQGLLIDNGSNTRIIFGQYTASAQRLYATYASSTQDQEITYTAPPIWLRINRASNSWSFRYSLNGSSWTDFWLSQSYTMTVSRVGIYCANFTFGGGPPAYTAKFDYFQENSQVFGASEDTYSSLAGTRRIFIIT